MGLLGRLTALDRRVLMQLTARALPADEAWYVTVQAKHAVLICTLRTTAQGRMVNSAVSLTAQTLLTQLLLKYKSY